MSKMINQDELTLADLTELTEGEENALELSTEDQDELKRAREARLLLSQLTTAKPPEHLPLDTAQKARRWQRLRRSEPARHWLDLWLITLIIVTVICTLSFLIYALNDIHLRDDVRVVHPPVGQD